MKKFFTLVVTIICMVIPVCCCSMANNQKRLLYINSYHQGYQWSDDLEKGLLKALKVTTRPDGSYDSSKSSVEIRVFRMDTKIHKSEEFKKQAALQAKAIIEEWQPDIVVASDDNASKYLIVPYYKNASLPFVFCGVNWDASVYGFPTTNITGMVEVKPVLELVALLSQYAKGDRVSYLGPANLSGEKSRTNAEKLLGSKLSDVKLVDTFDQWKQAYLTLQENSDMLILMGPIGIQGWEDAKAISFIHQNTIIPTGARGDNDIRYALLGKVGIAEEQGWWAGNTALKILAGAAPGDIPVTANKQTRLYLNMRLAKQLGIKFSMELIKQATFVEE